MGAGQSTERPTAIAEHYKELVDSMMNNQLTFDVKTRNIAETEQEWFREFEKQLENGVQSEDSLYNAISEFVSRSRESIAEGKNNIEDPNLRKVYEQVLKKTETAVVLQKYYEYKYLHLSAIFIHFAEFVHKIFDVTGETIKETTAESVSGTKEDLNRLYSAIDSVNISQKDADLLRNSVSAVHDASEERLASLSKRLSAITRQGTLQTKAFPMKQFEEQLSAPQPQSQQQARQQPQPQPRPQQQQQARQRPQPQPPQQLQRPQQQQLRPQQPQPQQTRPQPPPASEPKNIFSGGSKTVARMLRKISKTARS